MTEWLSSLAAEYARPDRDVAAPCAATIAGMVVGINRDIHNKPIGMRTLGLVSLGAAIVILAGSVYEGMHFGQDAVSRVIQGIMTGLGFLGAGAILRAPERDGGSRAHHGGDGLDRCGARGGRGLGAWFVTIAGTLVTLLLLTLGKPLEDMLTRLFSPGEKPADD